MLSKKNRLLGKSSFEKVKNQGKVYQESGFGLLIFDRGDAKEPKFGFIVSLRVSKKASARNRLKRISRNEISFLLNKIKNNFDCLFLFKRNSLYLGPKVLRAQINNALRKAEILK